MSKIMDDNGLVIESSTGEVIMSNDELKDIIIQRQKDEFKKGREILQSLGLDQEYNLIKINKEETDTILVKKGYDFNRIFRVEMRNVMNNKLFELSLGAKAFIGQFTPFITFPENSIIVDGNRPTINDYMNLMGIGKSKLYSIFKELEKYEIIKRVNLGTKLIIYFNPYLYSCGYVNRETCELFKDSTYAVETKVEYVK